MYLDYFALNRDPFRLSPDAHFYYPGDSYQKAKSYMEYVLWSRDSFVLLTGEIGTGKTTLIQKMLKEYGQRICVAKIHQTQLDEIEFLQALLDQFGIEAFSIKSKVELLSLINGYLTKKYEEGETVVLIIDEAQNLSLRVLEEIRLLSGFDSHREKLISVFLVGQCELRQKILSPEMEQLYQRIRLRYHLKGLDEEDTRLYIRHRLAKASAVKFIRTDSARPLLTYQPCARAGAAVNLFADDLMPVIQQYTGGIPRLINTLCDTALLVAFVQDREVIDAEVIRLAVEDLHWSPRLPSTQGQTKAGTSFHAGILINEDQAMTQREELNKSVTMIGRSLVCDIVLKGKTVSARHCLVVEIDGHYELEDLGSTNTTRLNGKPLRQQAVLKGGDVITVGNSQLTFCRTESGGSVLEESGFVSTQDEAKMFIEPMDIPVGFR